MMLPSCIPNSSLKPSRPSFSSSADQIWDREEMATGSGLFTFLRPRLRPQSTDIAAAATWGVAAATGALWLIQVQRGSLNQSLFTPVDYKSQIQVTFAPLIIFFRISLLSYQLKSDPVSSLGALGSCLMAILSSLISWYLTIWSFADGLLFLIWHSLQTAKKYYTAICCFTQILVLLNFLN